MTPAEELRAAATKASGKAKPLLEASADKTWPGEWTNFFTLHGADLGLLREDEEWVALMSPAVGEPLADWLEEEARQYDLPPCDDPTGVCNRCEHQPGILAALAVARALNGGEPGA